jgi:hypothetical protein
MVEMLTKPLGDEPTETDTKATKGGKKQEVYFRVP